MNLRRVCPKATMAEKIFSYGGQFSNKLQLQRIAFQKVWCEEMTEEQIMNPTLISRTVIIGVRNIYDYPDALLEMNDLFKRRLQQNVLFVSSEKGPTYEPRSKLQRQFGS